MSRRSGTAAAKREDQIPEQVKAQRSRRLIETAEAVRERVIAGWSGSRDTVLLEQPVSRGLYTGYTSRYIPVLVSAPNAKQGDLLEVTLEDFDGSRCTAQPV